MLLTGGRIYEHHKSYHVEPFAGEIDSSSEPNRTMRVSTQNCLKKSIKDPESARIKEGTATVGRCKKVQFQTPHSKNGIMLTSNESDEKTCSFLKSDNKSGKHNNLQDNPLMTNENNHVDRGYGRFNYIKIILYVIIK